MTTIDKLDMSVYNLYAIRTKLIEQINEQFRLEGASSVPPQTKIVDFYPKLTELDLLLGIVPLHTPWAYFYPPKKFQHLRRSPFAFSRIVPSLGTHEDQERDERFLESIQCETPEEIKEKKVITNCFSQIREINNWLGFIVGRVGQFLQG